MQIVIEIPDETYEDILNESETSIDESNVVVAVRHGTLLPKRHGDLIARDDLYNQTANWEAQALEQVNKYNPLDSHDDWRWWAAVLKERTAFKQDVANAKVIVPADKECD